MPDLYITAIPPAPLHDRPAVLEPTTPNSGRHSTDDLANEFNVDVQTDPEVDHLIDLYV